ncbi:MAG: diguanylate cyclase [Armatimonadetes bacterium]|nr:diguanylate cyclase [Armatimonadota bacterium]
MSLFRKKQPVLRPSSWEELDEAVLRERITPLVAYVAAALEASQGLVISPGSENSKVFIKVANELTAHLLDGPSSARDIDGARKEFSDAAQELGAWQREEIAAFQQETAEALRELIGSARTALDGQDETLDDFDRMNKNLEHAASSDDITQFREIVRNEIKRAVSIVESQRKRHDELKEELTDTMEMMEKKLDAVRGAGSKDYLTECASRAALDFYLAAICKKAQVEQRLYSIAMIDLDDFKGINDLWGHQEGDNALGHFVKIVKRSLPSRAFVGRYGGDEFVVVASMPEEDLTKKMSKLLQNVRATKIKVEGVDGATLSLSASAGVTEIREHDSLDSVLRRADEALFTAKQLGKGRVCRASETRAA